MFSSSSQAVILASVTAGTEPRPTTAKGGNPGAAEDAPVAHLGDGDTCADEACEKALQARTGRMWGCRLWPF